jgi:hypothetical protein
MRKIHLVYFDAGGGHRAAANALAQAIAGQQRPWDVRLVNLQVQLDELDVFRKLTGIRLEDIYNLLLRKGWTLGSAQLVPLMHGVIRMYHSAQVRVLARFWGEERPDLVVSLVPNFNRAMCEALQRALPGTSLVTVMTDLADYPPHFWIERQQQYLVCGTDRAVRQAREAGYPEDRVFRASGMILNPRFYDDASFDVAAERRKLGLDPDLPTALVMFGGSGSGVMVEIARTLDRSGLRLQMILIAGRNPELGRKLRALPHQIPIFIEGFTKEIPYYMHLSDFFIGKPGPGSISEALAMKLPVLVERNAWTLPQERYNAEWIVEQQVGLVLRNFRHVDQAVAELLQPENYRRFRAQAAAQVNRAVFEIPDFLEKLLAACETKS